MPCHSEKISLLLLGLGFGLLASVLLAGCFIRVMVGLGLVAVGLVVANCR